MDLNETVKNETVKNVTMDLNEIVKNVTMTKACSIKVDKDSKVTKAINLKVNFDGVLLSSVFEKAVAGTVIQWQNGVGRKNFDTYESNQVVEIQFSTPASRTAIDPETAMIAKLQSMSPTAQKEYIASMIKIAAANNKK